MNHQWLKTVKPLLNAGIVQPFSRNHFQRAIKIIHSKRVVCDPFDAHFKILYRLCPYRPLEWHGYGYRVLFDMDFT